MLINPSSISVLYTDIQDIKNKRTNGKIKRKQWKDNEQKKTNSTCKELRLNFQTKS